QLLGNKHALAPEQVPGHGRLAKLPLQRPPGLDSLRKAPVMHAHAVGPVVQIEVHDRPAFEGGVEKISEVRREVDVVLNHEVRTTHPHGVPDGFKADGAVTAPAYGVAGVEEDFDVQPGGFELWDG